MKRLLMIAMATGFAMTSIAQNINKAEYFFDHDPGQGNGILIPIGAPGETVSFPASISLSALSTGFHTLAIRVCDVEGKWSRFDYRTIYILSAPGTNVSSVTAAEYFFDHDPGAGSGIPTSVGTAGDVVTFTSPIPANLSPGFHWLGIRTKDSDGRWGLYERREFYLTSTPVDMTAISAAEYFFDHDPGVGNGTPLAFTTPAYTVSQTFPIQIPAAMPGGPHLFVMRVKDQQGNWSLFAKDSINVGNATATISCPGNVIKTTTSEFCNKIVDSIDPVVSPAGTAFRYTLSGATSGTDTGTASGHYFNVGVTTVTYSLVNSPTTTCSFTATVNANVVPDVTITPNISWICQGTQINFAPIFHNGGYTPTFQWKKNGVVVATTQHYIDTAWNDHDTIRVTMNSSVSCANPQTVTSTPIVLSVTQSVTPAVSITASQSTICPGQQLTFTADTANGGSSPNIIWVKNHSQVAIDTYVYQTSSLQNGDTVFAYLNSNAPCTTISQVISNKIIVTVNSQVTPSITIATPQTSICSGTQATFTATPTNGGNPIYQWKLNGNNVGDGSNVYETSTLNSGDEVKVVMTSSLGCANPQQVTSNPVTMTVLQSSPASVSISTSATTICSGSTVTFTAAPFGGGTPTYQWKLNGNNVGNNSPTYVNSSLQNGDKVKVIMTPSSPCAFPSPVVSNEIVITVNSNAAPTVTITASQTTICTGQLVTFTAAITNGGTAPAYEWTKNGNVVGSNSNVYQTSFLANGDVVRLTMQAYGSCWGNAPVYSNSITINVGTGVIPSVTIGASAIDICAGTPVTFTATPTNGGSNPHYQWKLNGTNVGGDSAVFHSSTLGNTDTIRVMMTSSLGCATTPTAISNYISMDVTTPVAASVTIAAEQNPLCSGSIAKFTAYPVNGGSHPSYQWKLNGNNVGQDSAVYTNGALQNGDIIYVEMSSSLPCVQSSGVQSNAVSMYVDTLQTYYRDNDGDGYGDPNSTITACGVDGRSSYVRNGGDCNDNNTSIHPGAAEICGNGIDDDCDGLVDEDCNTNLPVLIVRTYPVMEGNAGLTSLKAVVTLDRPAPAPVSLHYATSNEDATAGLDYVSTSGILTIPAGSSRGTIEIKIIGDLLREGNERFLINFTDPVNVTLGTDPHSRIMIIDDDKAKLNTRDIPINTTTIKGKTDVEDQLLKIPSVARRNHVWVIPRIEEYENEVLIMDTQGQLVSRFVNYKNHASLSNVSAGIYFYQIRILDGGGQGRYYSGRLLITE